MHGYITKLKNPNKPRISFQRLLSRAKKETRYFWRRLEEYSLQSSSLYDFYLCLK